MSQYAYAKDNRSDSKYQSDFNIGTHNQELAIKQFQIDRLLVDPYNPIAFKHNPDKTFQKEDGTWEYNPDYIIFSKGNIVPLEVKVQMTPLSNTIDLKCSQVYRLKEVSGYILYALRDRYSLIEPSTAVKLGTVINSDRFGGKKVFQIGTDLLRWVLWIHYPDFVKYN